MKNITFAKARPHLEMIGKLSNINIYNHWGYIQAKFILKSHLIVACKYEPMPFAPVNNPVQWN